MSDEDIKKALECCGCGVTKCVCNECPIRYRESCFDDLPKIALDLINRQQTEIERLQKYSTEVAFKHYNDGRAEAIKEFAEIIVADYPEMEFYLEKLLAEMAGEQL